MRRLEMGHIYIKDIQFAAESKIEDGILYVNKEAVEAVALEDEHIKSVSFDIARPGESVRITPVKDVIEPRVKVEGRGGVFPGVINKVDTVGEGKTYALKGMTTGWIWKNTCFRWLLRSYSRKNRWIPGRYHRYDRCWSTVYTILKNIKSCYGM